MGRTMLAATVILWVAGAYAGVGAMFALAFVTAGVSRVDPAARGSTWMFRVLIAPGSAALWPWLLRRWVRAGGKPEAHR